MTAYLRLGVNIDHVATVRNARGGDHPDPVRAANLASFAGADGITVHLREDRRHIRDADVVRLKQEIITPLNFEMAPNAEMVAFAQRLRPHAACLVPERREERTTEGGLDLASGRDHVGPAVWGLRDEGVRVSLFIEPDPHAIDAAHALKADAVELHTGAYAEAVAGGATDQVLHELFRLRAAAAQAAELGLEVHAGHGLTLDNVRPVAAIPAIVELNIGHFLVGEALFLGIETAVQEMRAAMDQGRASTAPPKAEPAKAGRAWGLW